MEPKTLFNAQSCNEIKHCSISEIALMIAQYNQKILKMIFYDNKAFLELKSCLS